MTTKLKTPPKKLKLGHLYEHPDLYQIIFGQHTPEDVIDAEGACAVVDYWLVDKAKALDFDIETGQFKSSMKKARTFGLNVCEIFSGPVSRHRNHFCDAFAGSVSSWKCLDKTDGSFFDVTKDKIPKPHGSPGYDAVFAFCYSSAGVLDGVIPASYNKMLDVFANVNAALRTDGLFVLDMPDSLSDWAYGSVTYALDGVVQIEPVPAGSNLRKMLGLPVFGFDVRVEYRTMYEYDRVTKTIYCHFDGPVKVFCGSLIVQSITVSAPFSWIAWTESELISMAIQSGFKPEFYPMMQSRESGNMVYRIGQPQETEATHNETDYKNLMPHKLGFVKA